ncbi:MAG: DDE-type integrase/transposase/recombinase [Candidatus Caldarchaeum sp.]
MGLEAPGVQEVFRVKYSVSLFLVDEAAVMVKGFMAWVWVAYEPFSKRTLSFRLSWIRNGIQAGMFLRTLVEAYGKHPVWNNVECVERNYKHVLLIQSLSEQLGKTAVKTFLTMVAELVRG